MIRRGQVRWYEFAKPDKKRPVVILTRDSILEYMGEVTVAPLTTTIREIPSEVALSEADGVPQPCAINCDHIQSVPKARIGALITTLSQSKLQQIEEAIAFALGFRA
jgi:mRNA interferase MazF